MKDKLISASIDGTLGITDISAKRLNAFFKKHENSPNFSQIKYT